MTRTLLTAAMMTLWFFSVTSHAIAEDHWPRDQAIHLIVPYAAGGNADVVARVTANYLTKALDTQVVVENRSGAGGTIGTLAVVHAPADGYWFCVCGIGSISIAPATRDIPYNPLKDIIGVSLLNTSPLILVVNRETPPRTVAEFIAWAKTKPKGLSYGSSGSGGMQNVAGEVFKERTKIKLTHVPYRGSGLATTALLTGEVDAVFALASDVIGQIRDNAVRPIGVTSSTRSQYLPDVPTIMEQGVENYDLTSWNALFAPAKTPKLIIDKLATVLAEMAKSPEVLKINADFGATATSNKPEQFEAALRSESVRWEEYLKLLNRN